MCYPKPGPRCSSHALKTLRAKKNALEVATTSTSKYLARMEYEGARRQFYVTTAGLDYLENKVSEGDETEDWQAKLDQARNERVTRLQHMKAEESLVVHQDTEANVKKLGLVMDKSAGLPAGRYLDSIAPVEDFEAAYRADLIEMRPHPDPSVPYVVLDYSRQAQYAQAWNTVTVNARGLIINKNTGEIVSRPFRKFFNHNQDVEGLTEFDRSGPVVVTEKLDGSMTSLYPMPDGTMAMSTRGSMASEQAKSATAIYKERYAGQWTPDPDRTYVFEYISPDNRIVVNYGDKKDVMLIGAVDKNTGRSVPLNEVTEWRGERAKQYEFSSYREAMSHKIGDDEEGVVVHFTDSDERVKLKGETYLRLHKIATNLTSIGIWEKVSSSSDDSWVADMPDEFSGDINTSIKKFRGQHRERLDTLQAKAAKVKKDCGISDTEVKPGDRKRLAQYITKTQGSDARWVMPLAMSSNGQSKVSTAIWKELRPKGKQPLVGEDES